MAEMNRLRVLVVAGLVAAALGPTLITTSVAPATSAGADPVGCEIRDAGGQCVGTNHRQRPASSGGAASRGPLNCSYIAFPDQAYGYSLFPPPDNPVVDGIIVFRDCGRPQGNGRYDPWEQIRANGSIPGFTGPASVPRPVTWADPAEIAEDLLAQVIANLPPPEPIVSPPPTGAAIIDQPTFVAVANWPGTIGPLPARDGPVAIELTAVPRLVFTPGDGSDPISCEGDGTRFDPSPSAPEPAEQSEGACAHVYDSRTQDGPWPGSLAIHWEVIWTSMTPDDDGVIDVVPQGVPVPRQVDEVQGLVVDPQEVTG